MVFFRARAPPPDRLLLLRLAVPRELLALAFWPGERERVLAALPLARFVVAFFKPPLGRTVKDWFVLCRDLPARDLVFVAIKICFLLEWNI